MVVVVAVFVVNLNQILPLHPCYIAPRVKLSHTYPNASLRRLSFCDLVAQRVLICQQSASRSLGHDTNIAFVMFRSNINVLQHLATSGNIPMSNERSEKGFHYDFYLRCKRHHKAALALSC